MKLVIQLTQDNGTLIRAHSRDISQAEVTRVVAFIRNTLGTGGIEAPTDQELFVLWATNVIKQLRRSVKEYEEQTNLPGAGLLD